MSPKRKPKKRPTISTYFSSSSSPSAFATTQTQTSRRAKRQKITSNDDMEGDGDAELTPVQLAAHSQFQPSLIAPAAETMRGILAPDSAEIIINNDEEDVDDETTSTSLTRTTSTTLTPLHQQVLQLKSRHPGVLLMIEVGYKMRFFDEDAVVAAKALGIYCGVDKGMKSASVPVHRLGVHCLKLCELGFKVGIVRQTETKFEKAFSSANKAAPFDRRLSAIYTRGTYMAPDVAVLDDNNWLCIVNEQLSDPSSSTSCKIGILMIELSLGKLVFDSFSDNIMRSDLETRLSHFQPVEIISSDSLSSPTLKTINRYVNSKLSSTVVVRVEKIASSLFENNKVDISRIVKSFHSDTSPNISSNSPVVIRAACKLSDLPVEAICLVNAALDHFTDYRINLFQLSFSHFSTLKTNMILTAETLRALEIFQNENGGEHGSLFWLMDHTKTLMGKRMLKNWISKPLIDSSSLQNRIDCVEVFKNHDSIFKRFESTLHQLPDLEKMLAKLHMRKISPANLLSMLSAFEKIGAAVSMDAVEEELEISRSKSRAFLEGLLASLPLVFRVATRLRQCLNDTSAKENNLVNLFHHSQDFIVDVEQEESLVSWKASLDRIAQLKREIAVVEKELDSHFREVTRNLPRAISSCSFQIVSGIEFLIPIPTSLSTIVPKDWIKISQTKTIGRYHTPFITDRIKFKGLLSEQLEERSRTSFSLFLNAVNDAGFEEFRRAIDSIAVLDCLFSLARLSTTALYSKPVLQDTPLIEIKGGRHPIAERLVTDFVGNDTHISQEARCVLITGPNMAGKSSYLRQVALIVLMCQIGSYVPCESANLGIFDAIYTRMGAADRLDRGQSTFMKELVETNLIFSRSSNSSLVILDEIGRGTATNDGCAIAHAVLDYLVKDIKCATFFTTHFPILGSLETEFPNALSCMHMSYHQESSNREVVFLYKLVKGITNNSFGLNVARMAQVCEEVLVRAKEKRDEKEAEYLRG